jgi:hypothetical protein
MDLPSTKSDIRPHIKPSFLVFWVIALGMILFAAVFAIFVERSPKKIEIVMDTNGVVRLWGFPLKNQRVRDGAFWFLGEIKGKECVLTMPGQWSSYTNVRPQILQISKEMGAAGLIPPLKPPQIEPLVLLPKETATSESNRSRLSQKDRRLVLLPGPDGQ